MFIASEEAPACVTGASNEVSTESIPQATVPQPSAAELIQSALGQLALSEAGAVAEDLKLREIARLYKVGMTALKSEYAAVKAAQSDQNRLESMPVLSEEETEQEAAAKAEEDAECRAEAEAIQGLVERLQRMPDLHPLFHAALNDGAGFVCDLQLSSTIFLTHGARLLDHSTMWIICGASGSGKTDGLKKAAEFLPSEDVLDFTSVTSGFFYYLGSQQHRYFLTGEFSPRVDGEDDPMQCAVRQLVSDNKITRGTVEKTDGKTNEASQKVTEGPLAIVATTNKAITDFDDQIANRATWIQSDDTPEQTAKVLNSRAKRAANPTEARDHKHALMKKAFQQFHRQLKPLTVSVPFAHRIKPVNSHVTARRLFNLILDYIAANVLLHQHSRERQVIGSQEVVIATVEDYQLAYSIATANAPRVLELCPTKARKAFDETLKPEFLARKAQGIHSVTSGDILRIMREPQGTVRHWLDSYVQAGLLTVLDWKANRQNVYALNEKGEHVTQDLGLVHPSELAPSASVCWNDVL
jgi:hypothetical protein